MLLRKEHARRTRAARRNVQLRISGEAGAGESPLTGGAADVRRGTAGALGALRRTVFAYGATVDSAGAVAASAVAAGFIHGAQRTLADGRAGLQPVVPVVCGVAHGRCGVGRNRVQQEPEAADRRRDRGGVLGGGVGASAASAVAQ